MATLSPDQQQRANAGCLVVLGVLILGLIAGYFFGVCR